MPVGETGGAKVKGGKAGGGSPGLHKRLCARKLGDTGISGASLALDQREGAAPPSPVGATASGYTRCHSL